MAFWAELNDGTEGIFVGDVTTLETVATEGDVFDYFVGSPVIDAAGHVYFLAQLTAGGRAIYRWDGDESAVVVGSDGPWGWPSYDQLWVNDAGQVLFAADWPEVLYVGPEPDVRRVVGGSGRFFGGSVEEITPLGLNAGGQALFHAGLQAGEYVDVLALATPASGAGEVMYVKAGACGLNDGTSWDNAFGYLSDALGFACPDD